MAEHVAYCYLQWHLSRMTHSPLAKVNAFYQNVFYYVPFLIP